eukprot:CAMPEP_0176229356 /NCGR_PEP_ID=MMETSP0121_2-20121125/23748_1 /TAXON_ID=160619 /ORGANISM="Kryptoperidinium foliaceum, Strain CCMP 1326" /LENGTH=165 /DNA_ID=CAMNT_0017568679 /DNA_START=192 /DNA_END=689 /DNA_ORIENTATION=+
MRKTPSDVAPRREAGAAIAGSTPHWGSPPRRARGRDAGGSAALGLVVGGAALHLGLVDLLVDRRKRPLRRLERRRAQRDVACNRCEARLETLVLCERRLQHCLERGEVPRVGLLRGPLLLAQPRAPRPFVHEGQLQALKLPERLDEGGVAAMGLWAGGDHRTRGT